MPIQSIDDFDYTKREVLDVVSGYPQCDQLSEDVCCVFNLWLDLKGEGTLPYQDDFRLDDFPPKIVPWAIVYDVEDAEEDFYYRFFGTQRVSAHKKDYTGLHVSDMEPLSIRHKILGELRSICADIEPILITTTARAYDEVFQYRMLRLPLSENGETVSRIVALTFDGTGPELDTHLMRRWHQI